MNAGAAREVSKYPMRSAVDRTIGDLRPRLAQAWPHGPGAWCRVPMPAVIAFVLALAYGEGNAA